MAISNPRESIISSVIGFITGALCRSDAFPFKSYRLPRWVNRLASLLRPIIGSTEPGFRSISALPEHGIASTRTYGPHGNGDLDASAVGLDPSIGFDSGGGTGRGEGAPRAPAQEEIAQLTAMFPDATRLQIVNALSST